MPPESSESRSNYDSLVPWARRLYAKGNTPHEVITTIYGADLPVEAYVFWDAYSENRLGDLHLHWETTTHPWELLNVEDPSWEPDINDGWLRQQEERAHAHHASLIPLMRLWSHAPATNGHHLIAYNAQDLANGTPTIYAHHDDIPDEGASFKILGPSLLEVLHKTFAAGVHDLQEQLDSPRNFGFGSIEKEHVAAAQQKVALIEMLQHDLADRTRS